MRVQRGTRQSDVVALHPPPSRLSGHPRNREQACACVMLDYGKEIEKEAARTTPHHRPLFAKKGRGRLQYTTISLLFSSEHVNETSHFLVSCPRNGHFIYIHLSIPKVCPRQWILT